MKYELGSVLCRGSTGYSDLGGSDTHARTPVFGWFMGGRGRGRGRGETRGKMVVYPGDSCQWKIEIDDSWRVYDRRPNRLERMRKTSSQATRISWLVNFGHEFRGNDESISVGQEFFMIHALWISGESMVVREGKSFGDLEEENDIGRRIRVSMEGERHIEYITPVSYFLES